MDIFDEINHRITTAELVQRGILTPAKKSGYVCPKCKNGTGKSGDGLTCRTDAKGKTKYHCFGECGNKDYSTFDLLAIHYGFDYETEEGKTLTIEKVKEDFGITDNSFSFKGKENKTKSAAPMKEEETAPPKNYSRLYSVTGAQLGEFLNACGGSYRGISGEVYQTAKTGFKRAEKGQKAALIFPHDDFHYFEREIDGDGKKIFGKGGALYRADSIQLDGLNFITEGEFDCLSIVQALGDSAGSISIGGTNGVDMCLRELDKRYKAVRERPKFIILPDNDNAGEKAAQKLLAALNAAGYPAVSYILSSKYKDCNEFLQADSSGFIRRLFDIIEQAGKVLSEIEDSRIDNELGIGFGSFFKNYFTAETKKNEKFADRKSGFKNLDKVQIFCPGLYVLGALSSLGKTTFAWQLAEQFARRGEYCIYCSYEMSALELFSKSVSRALYLKGERVPAVKIRQNCYQSDNYAEILKKFANDDLSLRVFEMRDEQIDELLEKLRRVCDVAEQPPIIFVDYLQQMPIDSKTDKRVAIDDTVRKLKNFQRETDTTFFVISAFNRTSYQRTVSFESFKESGGIEYSADVLWGLQFFYEDEKERDKLNSFADSKKETPRKIHLSCLKNRQGRDYDVYFKYFAECDYFESCEKANFGDDVVDV